MLNLLELPIIVLDVVTQTEEDTKQYMILIVDKMTVCFMMIDICG